MINLVQGCCSILCRQRVRLAENIRVFSGRRWRRTTPKKCLVYTLRRDCMFYAQSNLVAMIRSPENMASVGHSAHFLYNIYDGVSLDSPSKKKTKSLPSVLLTVKRAKRHCNSQFPAFLTAQLCAVCVLSAIS